MLGLGEGKIITDEELKKQELSGKELDILNKLSSHLLLSLKTEFDEISKALIRLNDRLSAVEKVLEDEKNDAETS